MKPNCKTCRFWILSTTIGSPDKAVWHCRQGFLPKTYSWGGSCIQEAERNERIAAGRQPFCRTCRWFLYPEASAGDPDVVVTHNCPYSYHRVGPGKYDGYTTGGREACDHYEETAQKSIVFS